MSNPVYLATGSNSPLISRAVEPAQRAWVVPLSADRCAVFFEERDAQDKTVDRIGVTVAGQPLQNPLMILRLACANGTTRVVILLAQHGGALCKEIVHFSRGKDLVAVIDPMALQSPLVDSVSLLSGLSRDGQNRLLRVLLTTGPSLFKGVNRSGGALDGFETVISRLLSTLASGQMPLQSCRALGKNACLLSFDAPHGTLPPQAGDLVEITNGHARRITAFSARVDEQATKSTLHLILHNRPECGSTLICISDTPMRLAGPAGDAPSLPVQPWIARQTPALKRDVLTFLNPLGAHDPVARALQNELQCPDSEQPILSALYAGFWGTGLLYAVKAQDPHCLLSHARWTCGSSDFDIPLSGPVWHPAHGDICIGFLTDVRPQDDQNQSLSLWGALGSRRAFKAVLPDIARFDGLVPDLFQQLNIAQVDDTLAQAMGAALPFRRTPKHTMDWFGARPDAPLPGPPQATILIMMDEMFDFPRALLTRLCQEKQTDQAVILVAQHPDQRGALRDLAEGLAAITGLAIGVICVDQGAFPSERLRVGITQHVGGPLMIFSGSCLPDGPIWNDRWQVPSPSEDMPRVLVIPVDCPYQSASHEMGCVVLNQRSVELCAEIALSAVSLDGELAHLVRRVAVSERAGNCVVSYSAAVAQSDMLTRLDARTMTDTTRTVAQHFTTNRIGSAA